MGKALGKDATCSIARSLDVVGDSWTLLIVREALVTGATRFQDFRDSLGIASNILTGRLAALVDEGLMERRTYQESGSRPRDEYVLTEAGLSLSTVIAALSDWGRTYRPRPDGTSPQFSDAESGEPARLAFVTGNGEFASPAAMVARRRPDYPEAA
ncbi:helix-turn-helix transcriptional regulator [Actinoplanes sp. TBRC 11911]|uniref:winged helix-turn-helix transcriptional regulator n=1 Tax=Actinoplanes sp. TBRC 11911 TaxID=2729386 RepID=UPI00145C8D50|nr:helix-turn-helix domain-containing protein [Actinoplanes sp. TBRC 11911]NMO54734.1 helix-turn-helix transcriptional regulator [Actinoplanes sp. TBRC 11911]